MQSTGCCAEARVAISWAIVEVRVELQFRHLHVVRVGNLSNTVEHVLQVHVRAARSTTRRLRRPSRRNTSRRRYPPGDSHGGTG